jgi:ribose 5-phosphate isomerase B
MTKIYIAGDHGSFELKGHLIPYLENLGYEIEDCGAFTYDTEDDYPDFIKVAAQKLQADVAAGNTESRAVVLGGSGQGEAMAANRFRGVRCALYYGSAGREQTDATGQVLDIIASTRDHNDANALSLGARFLTEDEAKDALKRWLETPFSNAERHVRRIKKIDD